MDVPEKSWNKLVLAAKDKVRWRERVWALKMTARRSTKPVKWHKQEARMHM